MRVKVVRSLPLARSTSCTPAEVPTHSAPRDGSTVSARTYTAGPTSNDSVTRWACAACSGTSASAATSARVLSHVGVIAVSLSEGAMPGFISRS